MVNTEFQLRHLIIWSSIFIHVTSESGDARVRTGLRERLRERLGVRTRGADGASDGRPAVAARRRNGSLPVFVKDARVLSCHE